MSRAFSKEGDQQDLPIIPPRAELPEGVPNYVTPVGLQQLLNEQLELETQQAKLSKEDTIDANRALVVIDIQLTRLNHRIAKAREIDFREQPADEVRFGATVTLKMGKQKAPQTFQIVGVDEANVKLMKIAFVAPIAKAIMGKKVGEKVEFKLGDEVREVEILGIKYE